MPLALHRSLTFWSGLLVMGFLAWAWHDSLTWITSASKSSWQVRSSRAGFTIYHNANRGYGRNADAGRRLATPLPFAPDPLPPPLFLRGQGMSSPPYDEWSAGVRTASNWRDYLLASYRDSPPEDWMLFIPYWLILLTVATAWLGLLFWRSRRRKEQPTGWPER